MGVAIVTRLRRILWPWGGNEEIDPIFGIPGDTIQGGAIITAGAATAAAGGCVATGFNPVLFGGPPTPRIHFKWGPRVIRPPGGNPGPPEIGIR